MTVSLQILSIPDGEQIERHMILIGQPSSIVGRDLSCDIILPDQSRSVSRRHAELKLLPDSGATVRDISTNGTTINGEQLSSGHSRRLQDGDLLSIGGYKILISLSGDETQKPQANAKGSKPSKIANSSRTFETVTDVDESELLIPEVGHEFQVAHDTFENFTTDFPAPNAIMMDPFEESDSILDRALEIAASQQEPLKSTPGVSDPMDSNINEEDLAAAPASAAMPDPFDIASVPILVEQEKILLNDNPDPLTPLVVNDPLGDNGITAIEDPSNKGLVRQMASYRQFCTQSSIAALVTFLREISPEALSKEMDSYLVPGSIGHWSKLADFYANKLKQGDFSKQFNEHLMRELNKW